MKKMSGIVCKISDLPMNNLQNTQDDQKQRKSDKLSQPKEA
jgi:hypothetical protein